MSDTQLTFPNEEVKRMWPDLYTDIKEEVKDGDVSETLEARVRTLLKKTLGAENIRNDASYKKFFYEVIRFAVNMDTDKMLHRIASGRLHYGQNNHSKGKIETVEGNEGE
jgi:hypothetical protein